MNFEDTFRGDNAALLQSIEALLKCARANVLYPPVPGMPLQLLESAAARLAKADG
jgi:hypothetical protein